MGLRRARGFAAERRVAGGGQVACSYAQVVRQRERVSSLSEGGDMDPAFLAPFIPITAIIAFAAVKIARLRAAPGSPAADVTARLELLERSVQDVQQELAETQERLDFAERLLSKARQDRRIGG